MYVILILMMWRIVVFLDVARDVCAMRVLCYVSHSVAIVTPPPLLLRFIINAIIIDGERVLGARCPFPVHMCILPLYIYLDESEGGRNVTREIAFSFLLLFLSLGSIQSTPKSQHPSVRSTHAK